MKFENKTVLITGASGLVGVPLVEKAILEGAKKVIAVDVRLSTALTEVAKKYPDGQLDITLTDLTYLHNCEKLFKDRVDIVIHAAGIKGSPARAAKSPADYLFPMMMFNTNMIKAAHDAGVEWFVYVSSVGVYHPAELMTEHDVWNTMPSKNDWYPGWSKRAGELAVESLAIQHNWTNWTIIRPSNIYGVNDNFAEDATVVSSNIWKLTNVPGDTITCWGNGSARRDFVFGDDVAQACIDVVKKEVKDTINFGCGRAVTIKETIEAIVSAYKELTGKDKFIQWDETKPNGDPVRCLSADKQIKYDILPRTTLQDGIKKTVEAYINK